MVRSRIKRRGDGSGHRWLRARLSNGFTFLCFVGDVQPLRSIESSTFRSVGLFYIVSVVIHLTELRLSDALVESRFAFLQKAHLLVICVALDCFARKMCLHRQEHATQNFGNGLLSSSIVYLVRGCTLSALPATLVSSRRFVVAIGIHTETLTLQVQGLADRRYCGCRQDVVQVLGRRNLLLESRRRYAHSDFGLHRMYICPQRLIEQSIRILEYYRG